MGSVLTLGSIRTEVQDIQVGMGELVGMEEKKPIHLVVEVL